MADINKITEGLTGQEAADIIYGNDMQNFSHVQSLLLQNFLDNSLSGFLLNNRLSSNGGSLIVNTGNERTVTCKPVPIAEGQYYTVSGAYYPYVDLGIRGTISPTETIDATRYAPNWEAVEGGYSFLSPISGYLFVDYRLNEDLTALLKPSQIEFGKGVTDYKPVGKSTINPKKLPDVVGQLKTAGVIIEVSKNMINPAGIKFDRRYSTGSKSIIAIGANLIAPSWLIEVTPGKLYTVSGDGIYGITTTPQGGYFPEGATDTIGQVSIDNITFIRPVTGPGFSFQVPTGRGIKYVIISLNTDADRTAIVGNAQLEAGEMATDYEPYKPKDQIAPDYLPANGGGEIKTDKLAKYTTFGVLSYGDLVNRLPNFRKHWIAKDKDLIVLNTGTSLTARSIEHCTDHKDASIRPPLMHSNNFATHIWDALKWQGQEYRRYDSNYFTEAGVWATSSNLAEWDDGPYRSGLTRYSDTADSTLAFQMPVNAWQFSLIYRTDSVGSEDCRLTIAEGNGQVEVFNGNTWVEANGFIFSMREIGPTILPSITYTDPTNETVKTVTNYQVGGNTTYQKRLKMRCRSTAINSMTVAKNVTVSRTSGRLMYWGVEWSPREFMLTYINAARGSHSITIESERSLSKYQDNEVWQFKPDLLLTENPIHNSGGAGKPSSSYPSSYWGTITDNFFMADNCTVSLKIRATALSLDIPEFCIFNSTITWNFGGIDEEGNLIIGIDKDGRAITALDAQMLANEYLTEKYGDQVVNIQAVKHFVDACYACYGNMKDATVGSGKNGLTFTNEGSHWNDTGSRVMARVVLPILDLY